MTTASQITIALDEARAQLIDAIETATGLSTGTAKSLFVDNFPPSYNTAALFIGGGSDVIPWQGDNPPVALNMDFRIEARFILHSDAWAFAIAVMSAFPIKANRITVARPTAVPKVEGKYFKYDESDPQLLFAVDIPGLLVFSIG